MTVAEAGTVLLLTAAATALAGGAVSAVAYRGWRRHDSATMRWLAVGIALVTVAPFLVSYGVAPVLEFSDAQALLAILSATVAGLVALVYSLDGA